MALRLPQLLFFGFVVWSSVSPSTTISNWSDDLSPELSRRRISPPKPNEYKCTSASKIGSESISSCQPNPCKNGGRCINEGTTLSCKCPVQYGGAKCEEQKGECVTYGDPHYFTFNKQRFDFMGKGRFVLSEDCVDKTFKLRMLNDYCGHRKDVTCLIQLLIQFNGNIIRFYRNKPEIALNQKKYILNRPMCGKVTFVANFTNLGASGPFGPTSLGSFYAGQDHENMVTVANGIQYWTVPFTGTYQITAVGASGGYDRYSGPAARGRGAYMKGDFDLNKGEVIKILVGQQGVENTIDYSAGGGGGTFVVTSSNKPVIIAGGGGGIAHLKTRLSNCDASVGTSGKKNQCDKTKRNCSSWSGGVNGSGALEVKNSFAGGGGGGFYSNGRSSKYFGGMQGDGGEGGESFLQGGAGGYASYRNAVGGFGGGGGADGWTGGAGGGGGYSGGASGYGVLDSCGGGGGSYNSGRNQENNEGFQDNGHGYVEINRIFPDV